MAAGDVDRDDEALLHQATERLDQRSVLATPADRLGGGETEAPVEHREPGEGTPLGGLEQVVAPVDRRSQRPLSLWGVGGAVAREVQPPAQAVEERGG